MKRFDPDLFLVFANISGFMEGGIAKSSPDAPVPERVRRNLAFLANNSAEQCGPLGLVASSASASRLAMLAGGEIAPTYAQTSAICEEFRGRLQDELKATILFSLDAAKAKLYTETALFGDQVASNFPSGAYDIEEAGKCLATGRSTACVFHCMRVMEVGLKALALAMEIPYAPSWESYIKQINAKITTDWKDKEPEWKKNEQFFAGAVGDLTAVKNAWRNPTMHIRGSYDPERAEDIFNAVKGFMRHLAIELTEEP